MKSVFCCLEPIILLGFKLGNLAETKGFEPLKAFTLPAFQASALDRYATSPFVSINLAIFWFFDYFIKSYPQFQDRPGTIFIGEPFRVRHGLI